MAARHAAGKAHPTWQETENQATVLNAAHQYAPYLPKDRSAPILDLGFGGGWFVAACLKLGYEKIYGADFGIAHKQHVREWARDRVTLLDIPNDIGEFLSDKQEQFEFIHMSHVIEHVPKYSLLWVVDSLYWALRRGGSVLLRTPNMEGPCANSSLYVTWRTSTDSPIQSHVVARYMRLRRCQAAHFSRAKPEPGATCRQPVALANSEAEPDPASFVWSE